MRFLYSAINFSIIISRHGSRGPYSPPSSATMDMYSETNYPFNLNSTDWGIDSPILSPLLSKSGRTISTQVGKYIGNEDYKFVHCDNLDIFADIVCERCIDTMKLVMSHMVPECPHLWNKSKNEIAPYDDSRSMKIYDDGRVKQHCKLASAEQIKIAVGGKISEYILQNKDAIDYLGEKIGCCKPELCENNKSRCTLSEIGYTGYGNVLWEPLQGSIAHFNYLTEFLLLQSYAIGSLPFNFTKHDLTIIDRLRSDFINLVQINRFNSRSFGSSLLHHISTSIDNMILNYNQSRVLFHFGHDFDIMKMTTLLGIKYTTLDFGQNSVPPNTLLIFEVHFLEEIGWVVQTFIRQPSMKSLMSQSLTGFKKIQVDVPDCSQTYNGRIFCRWYDFYNLARKSMNVDCLS